MPKAKRSRRENLSSEDAQKLRRLKQHEKKWKVYLKNYWLWRDKYDAEDNPEQKIKMKKEREQAEYRKEHGLKPQVILSENDQLILDLKLQAFKEMEKSPRTEEDIKLSEYSRK